MPARRSEDTSLTPAERSGEDALAHWDAKRRDRARPVPLERRPPSPSDVDADDVGGADPEERRDGDRPDADATGR